MKQLFDVNERIAQLYRVKIGEMRTAVMESCRQVMQRYAQPEARPADEAERHNLKAIVKYYLESIRTTDLAAINQAYNDIMTDEEMKARVEINDGIINEEVSEVINWLAEEATHKLKAMQVIIDTMNTRV